MNHDWMTRASCRGIDPAVFVPSELRAGHHRTVRDGLERAEKQVADELKALFCDGCPCWHECLSWAVENEELGVWAGTTTRERRFLVKLKRRPCDGCGSPFQHQDTRVRYCSDDCRRLAHRRSAAVSHALHADHDPYPKWSDAAITLDRERSA